jgi:hypothetical protein
MDKTMKNKPRLKRQTGNWDSPSKQSKEEIPSQTGEVTTFETGKEHDLFKRITDKPDFLHEEVMNIITNGKSGRN